MLEISSSGQNMLRLESCDPAPIVREGQGFELRKNLIEGFRRHAGDRFDVEREVDQIWRCRWREDLLTIIGSILKSCIGTEIEATKMIEHEVLVG